jgi:carbon storage regulator
MLILSRKSGESIVIDGRIRVKIVRVEGEVVKVGIEAPTDLPVHRQEVYEEIQRNNQQALTRQKALLPKMPLRKLAPSTAALGSLRPAAPVPPRADEPHGQ